MRKIPTSPRIVEIKRKRRKRKIVFIILAFILFLVFIFGLSVLSKNKHIVINETRVIGASVIDEGEIKDMVYQKISGKYIYLFSKSNSFIYPHRQINKTLRETFPRIESLNIKLDNLRILKIEITERKGEFLYCGENIPLDKKDIGENCYFVNNDGYIFDQAPYFSGNVYFKYYLPLSNKEDNPLGKQMLPEDKFHTIVRFVDRIETLGFIPIYFQMNKEEKTNYLYLKHKEGLVAPKIIFKDNDDFDDIFDDLSLAMRKKEFKEEVKNKYDTLLYIDMRFQNKIAYKFQ